ncbi:MAG: hypothetical protein PHY29_08960 [Syntrophales bacterium]|nr:hypothetical protein [Syntrophales bacterium]
MPVRVDVVLTKRDLNEFITFPWKIYSACPEWIPPLRYELKKRINFGNAFLRQDRGHLFLAKREKEIVGRLSVSIEKSGKKGNFGCYEAIDDPEIGRALFKEGLAWLKKKGVEKITGPIHFRLEDPYPGFLVEGHEHNPYFMMAYSMPYYVRHMEFLGFSPAMDLFSYEVSKERPLPREMVEKANEAEKIAGLKIREINIKKIHDEAELIGDIFNEALQNNWGYEPFSKRYVRQMASDLKILADPRIVFVAEVDGKAIGAVINLPNYNEILADVDGNLFPKGLFRLLFKRKKIKSLRGYALAVRDSYRGTGVGCLLVKKSFDAGIKAGYEKGEVTWILGSNKSMNSLAEFMGGNKNKTYRLYEKEL